MKKIILLGGFFLLAAPCNTLMAQDDVYDAPKPKKERVKQAYTEPVPPKPPVEQSVPYTDEEKSTSRKPSDINTNQPSFGQNDQRNNNPNDYSYGGGWEDDCGYGYYDRIRRFHNPSLRFSYGNCAVSSFYDPWYNDMSWNNPYYFTPSWTYSYSNFYNPFWGNQVVVIVQPWMSSWYSTGFYSPWNNWGWNSWNNIGWNGFSPYCSNAIFNNGFYNYGGYYDYNKKNVVYTPRTSGYGNTNSISGNKPYNKNYPTNTNTNNSGWNVNNNTNTNNSNNTQQPTPKKWSTNDSNNNPSNNTGKGWSNPYKNTMPATTPAPAPSNNNNNNNSGWGNNNAAPQPGSGSGGVKISTRPK